VGLLLEEATEVVAKALATLAVLVDQAAVEHMVVDPVVLEIRATQVD